MTQLSSYFKDKNFIKLADFYFSDSRLSSASTIVKANLEHQNRFQRSEKPLTTEQLQKFVATGGRLPPLYSDIVYSDIGFDQHPNYSKWNR